MLIQLNPSVPLDGPKGPCDALFLIDVGEQHHLQFVTVTRATGEFWTWRSTEVRLEKNVTAGVRTGEPNGNQR